MTTVRRSIPSVITPLTIEQRIAKAAKKAELAALAAAEAQGVADAAQVDADAAAVLATDAQADVDGALDGTVPFTGLNVGGTDVKPFLDQTDGTSLVNSAGLGPGVVETPKLNTGAANQVITASAATVALPAGVDTLVLSIAVTVVTGEVVDLSAQFSHLEISDATAIPQIASVWKRGITALPPSAVSKGIDVTRAADAARYVLAGGVSTVVATEIPGAGTHTYDLYSNALVAGAAINPAARLLTVTRP